MKKNARTFPKNSIPQEKIKISKLKKMLINLYKKENFKSELYQWSKIWTTSIGKWTCKRCKTSCKYYVGARRWKKLQNLFQCTLETICKIKPFLSYILMTRKENVIANPMIFFNQLKKFYEKLFLKRQIPKLFLLNFLSKFITERKCQMNNFTFMRL